MERGIITSVYYDNGIIECDVQPFRNSGIYRRIEYLPSNIGLTEVPQQGNTVNMLEDTAGTRYIASLRSAGNFNPDSLKEGEVALQIDKQTKVLIERVGDGEHNVTLEASGTVNIKSSGDLSVESSGDVNLQADGDIYIEGIKFSDHSHTHDDSTISDTSDGSGSETTTEKTTGPPQ